MPKGSNKGNGTGAKLRGREARGATEQDVRDKLAKATQERQQAIGDPAGWDADAAATQKEEK